MASPGGRNARDHIKVMSFVASIVQVHSHEREVLSKEREREQRLLSAITAASERVCAIRDDDDDHWEAPFLGARLRPMLCDSNVNNKADSSGGGSARMIKDKVRDDDNDDDGALAAAPHSLDKLPIPPVVYKELSEDDRALVRREGRRRRQQERRHRAAGVREEERGRSRSRSRDVQEHCPPQRESHKEKKDKKEMHEKKDKTRRADEEVYHQKNHRVYLRQNDEYSHSRRLDDSRSRTRDVGAASSRERDDDGDRRGHWDMPMPRGSVATEQWDDQAPLQKKRPALRSPSGPPPEHLLHKSRSGRR